MTLRELVWAADGRMKALWDMTALIVAKVHNAHWTEPIQPWQIGPYAVQAAQRRMEFSELVEMMKGVDGVTVGTADDADDGVKEPDGTGSSRGECPERGRR